ncbi:MAG: hypothetical protein ACKVQA_08100, partial [Burkholderiales bacterium]
MALQIVRDLPALIRPIAAVLAALVVSAMLVQFANRSVIEAKQKRDAQERALAEARSRVYKSGEERDLILKFLPAYYQLEKEGIVGAERRLDWLDALRVANTHADLYGVQYEITAQQPLPRGDVLGAPSLDVRHSLMKLKFGLLHEEDLSRFLNALLAQGVGAFLVNRCSLSQIRKLERPLNQPTLQAECE